MKYLHCYWDLVCYWDVYSFLFFVRYSDAKNDALTCWFLLHHRMWLVCKRNFGGWWRWFLSFTKFKNNFIFGVIHHWLHKNIELYTHISRRRNFDIGWSPYTLYALNGTVVWFNKPSVVYHDNNLHIYIVFNNIKTVFSSASSSNYIRSHQIKSKLRLEKWLPQSIMCGHYIE